MSADSAEKSASGMSADSAGKSASSGMSADSAGKSASSGMSADSAGKSASSGMSADSAGKSASSGVPTARRESAARLRVLDAAAELFYARGIRGVGLDTVIAASGVAKATLYAHFPTKEDLVLAYLDRADEAWQGKLHAAADAAGRTPRAQLVGLFDALTEACARTGFRGCAFLNAAAESLAGTPVHAATVAHKDAVRAWVTGLAAAAGAADPAALGRELTLVLDGALAAGALLVQPDIAEQAAAAARTLVAAACPPSPSPSKGR
jgi:AcrR family transcriptional regulator